MVNQTRDEACLSRAVSFSGEGPLFQSGQRFLSPVVRSGSRAPVNVDSPDKSAGYNRAHERSEIAVVEFPAADAARPERALPSVAADDGIRAGSGAKQTILCGVLGIQRGARLRPSGIWAVGDGRSAGWDGSHFAGGAKAEFGGLRANRPGTADGVSDGRCADEISGVERARRDF